MLADVSGVADLGKDGESETQALGSGRYHLLDQIDQQRRNHHEDGAKLSHGRSPWPGNEACLGASWLTIDLGMEKR